jgi:DNA polymerase-3 subunit delta'
VIIGTTENLYDLLPTIRSRSFILQMSRLSDNEMSEFAASRKLPDADTRIALCEGSPGLAVTLDVEQFRERRALVLAALECGASLTPFSNWVQRSESFGSRKSEKLDLYLKLTYAVLEDVLRLWQGAPATNNRDVHQRIQAISQVVTFGWIEHAVRCWDELVQMVRRNIQKVPALDAFIINLRNRPESVST